MSAQADRGGWKRFSTAGTLLMTDSQIPPSAPCRGHLPLKGGEKLGPGWPSVVNTAPAKGRGGGTATAGRALDLSAPIRET